MKALLLASALLTSTASASSMSPLLALRVEMSTGAVVAGAEAPLKVFILNTTEAPIDLPWPKWIDGYITTDSSLVNGKRAPASIKHKGLALGHGKYPGGSLLPGKEMAVDLTHVFPKAGVNTLTATLKLPEEHLGHRWGYLGAIKSKPIRVVVADPADNHSLD
ncbi:MAG: hypothetical protein ABL962_20830, partial [Fimbriimonadaceae bacterium]